MAELLTLDLSFAQYPITRRALAAHRQTPIGNGATQIRRLYARPIYEFTLHIGQAIKGDMMTLTGFLAYHQHDIPFWFLGGEWALIDSPILVGIGDGVRKEFFLPNRNIIGGFVPLINGAPSTIGWSLEFSMGLLSYATPPAVGAVLAATYVCRYKVTVFSGDESLFTQVNTGKLLYSQDQLVLRELVP